MAEAKSAGNAPDIVARLKAEGTEWAASTLKLLNGVSPTACVWTLRALRAATNLNLAEALAVTPHDFVSGAAGVGRSHFKPRREDEAVAHGCEPPKS